MDRCEIAAKLYQGVTFERILDDIRDNTESGLKKLHLATRKDITNIEKAFGLRRAERHKDDATSVATVVKEMIQKHHLTSNKLSTHLATQESDGEWIVQSSEANYEYTVTLENVTCQTDCRLFCNDCGICIHMYSCTCLDFLINYTICKHVHLVAKTNIKPKNEFHVQQTNNTVAENVASLAEKCLSIRLPSHHNENIMKVKQRISQKISAFLLHVKYCAALPLLISAEQHINSASPLLTLTENNGKPMAIFVFVVAFLLTYPTFF